MQKSSIYNFFLYVWSSLIIGGKCEKMVNALLYWKVKRQRLDRNNYFDNKHFTPSTGTELCQLVVPIANRQKILLISSERFSFFFVIKNKL